jgi:protein-S-isoprenylcysteine O-methyltransferase Ste14
MSLAPAFQIGLWNAWILMVLLFAASFVPLYIDNRRVQKRSEGEPTWSELSRASKTALVVSHAIIMPFTFLYSIVLPLKLGTFWFLAGLAVCLLGIVMVLMVSASFSTAPLGEPLDKGVYAISRHPGYFGFFLALAGVGIACASWVFMLCALLWIVSWHFGVIEEERFCLEKYGDAYREYMKRTPRWIGFPRAK